MPFKMTLLALFAVSPFAVALSWHIDQMAGATVFAAFLVAGSSLWNTWMLTRVHALVNSNFSEAKVARQAAETSLAIAQALNLNLQSQLLESKRTK